MVWLALLRSPDLDKVNKAGIKINAKKSCGSKTVSFLNCFQNRAKVQFKSAEFNFVCTLLLRLATG